MPGTRPPRDNLYIATNATFERYWPLTDALTNEAADMTGWYGACEVRSSARGGTILTKFATGTDPVYGGTLDFDGVGNMRLYLPIAQARALAPANGVFDIALLNPGGEWFIVLTGNAYILDTEVTDA